MYGTRARIGLLVPSANTTVEAEFNALTPEDVSVHAARMLLTHGTVDQLAGNHHSQLPDPMAVAIPSPCPFSSR